MKSPPDTRDKLWAELELKIQRRAEKKDRRLRLSGRWKKFLRRQEGFKIYAVDGEWVRINLSVIFGHGGHGWVHEFIPKDEIWVDIRHAAECGCKKVPPKRKVSRPYFDSTVIHEIAELRHMKNPGLPYWKAHNLALDEERRIGLLQDPFTDPGWKKPFKKSGNML